MTNQVVQFSLLANPYQTDLMTWADSLVLGASNLGTLPKLEAIDDYPFWAERIVNDPLLSAYGFPHPASAENWRQWAVDVIAALGVAGAS